MVTQITLGTYGVQDGKNVLTGGASQIDTKGLIDGLATAKRAPAVRLETANKLIDKQTTALNKLKTLLAAVQTAADTLRNPSGVDNASKNIFQYRTATLSNNTGTSSNYATVAVQPGATVQTHTIDSVTSLAQASKSQSANLALADSTTASAVSATGSLFKPGTVNFKNINGGTAVGVTLNEGDSLQTAVNKFNAVSSQTGIQYGILNVAPGQYKLTTTITKTGTAAAAATGVSSDPSGVMTQVAFTTTQTATDAVFKIDGVAVTRSTNVISDVLDNVTLTLKQTFSGTDTNGKLLMDIQPDTTLVANAITQLADSYNAFRLFASGQSQLDDNSAPKDTSVLYNDPTMRNLIADVSNEVTRIIQGITGTTTTTGGTPAVPASTTVSGNTGNGTHTSTQAGLLSTSLNYSSSPFQPYEDPTNVIKNLVVDSPAVTGSHSITVQQLATTGVGAQVAKYTIDGVAYTSATNTGISNIAGVTFDLAKVTQTPTNTGGSGLGRETIYLDIGAAGSTGNVTHVTNASTVVTTNDGSDPNLYIGNIVTVPNALPGAISSDFAISNVQLGGTGTQATSVNTNAHAGSDIAVSVGSPTATYQPYTITLNTLSGGTTTLSMANGTTYDQYVSQWNALSSQTGITASLNFNNGVGTSITYTGTPGVAFDLNQVGAAPSIIASNPDNQFHAVTVTQGYSASNTVFYDPNHSGGNTSIAGHTYHDANVSFDFLSNFPGSFPSSYLDITTYGSSTTTTSETFGAGQSIGGTSAVIGNIVTTSAAVTGTHTLTVTAVPTNDNAGYYTLDGVNYSTGDNASEAHITIIPGVSFDLLNTGGPVTINVTGATTASGGTTTTTPGLSQLADIGLTLDNFAGDDTNPATKNILTVDTDKLNSILASNFDGVAKLFEYQQTSNNSSFATFKTSNLLSVNAFTVNLVIPTGAKVGSVSPSATATYVDASGTSHTVAMDVSAISGGGYTINGKANTPFEGSQYVAGANVALGVAVDGSGNQNVAINVNVTQGYADRFYNLMDTYNNDTNGSVTTDISTLADTKKRKTDEITAIDDKIATYRAQLVQQYATLESSITKANNILQLLDAQTKAKNSSG